MNKIYNLVWNERTQAWVCVAETARSRGKRSSGISMIAALLASLGITLALPALAAPPAATALPTGAQVVGGQAQVQTSGAASMTVQQATTRAAIDWQTFNVGSQAKVTFQQPSAESVTLNRVLDTQPSQIFGQVSANGQVFLSNPAGVLFGPSASVDVGGLVATTHRLSTADFMAGKTTFERDGSTGSVVNQGSLQSALGGYVALLAPEVRNEGVVLAQAGTVALAAGEAVRLNFGPDSRLASITVTPGLIDMLVENRHAVLAPEGQIILSARAASHLMGSVVQSGELNASSLVSRGGKVILEGGDITLAAGSRTEASGATGGGTVLVGGDWQGSGDMAQARTVTMQAGAAIDASATHQGDGGKVVLWSDVHDAQSSTTVDGDITARAASGGIGGAVETSGAHLSVSGSVNAGPGGQWLVDPTDIVIANASALFTPAFIQSTLDNGTSMTMTTAPAGANIGNITISDPIATTSPTAGGLTLLADNNVAINASITLTGAGADLVVNAKNSILFTNNNTLTTNGGDVTLAARSAGAATGSIRGVNNLTISTGGGNITLGGGDATASGYAIGSATANALRTGVGFSGNINFSSAGGNIAIRGQAGTYDTFGGDVESYGAGAWGTTTLDSGTGTITVDGKSANAGTDDHNWATGFNGNATITSANTTAGAIRILGDATGAGSGSANRGSGVLFIGTGNQVTATGAGGGITLQGTRGSGTYDVSFNGGNLQAVSGDIKVLGTSTGGTVQLDYVGARNGSPVTSSTSNVTIQADKLISGVDVNTTGSFTMVPTSDSFAENSAFSKLTFNENNTTTSNQLSGFTWGKDLGAGTHTNNFTTTADKALSVNGPITLHGKNVSITQNLTTTADGARILVKTSGNISTGVDRTLQTNNGNITLWSDSDASGDGSIWVGDTNTLNSANGATTTATGGGHITLAGGLDDGSNGGTASDDIPDGFAKSTSTNGVTLDADARILVSHTTSLHTGGGDLTMRGSTTASNAVGVFWNKNGVANVSGGTIDLTGVATAGHGLEIGAFSGTSSLVSSGGDATHPAITVSGTGTKAGVQTNSGDMLSTGTGGIAITGNNGTATSDNAVNLGMSVLAPSGPIDITAVGNGVRYGGSLGAKAGTSVTSSTSPVTVTGDKLVYNGTMAVNTAGTVTVQPNSASFTTAPTFDGNFTVASTATELTLGKAGNTADITVSNAQTIAGPISVHGGNVTLNANLISTASDADLLVKATGNIVSNTNRTFQTHNGDITFWSNSDGVTDGSILLNNNIVLNSANGDTAPTTAAAALATTGTGSITLGGGTATTTTTQGTTIPSGAATYIGSGRQGGVSLGLDGGNTGTVYSGGGDIRMTGSTSSGQGPGVAIAGVSTLNSGTGTITLTGDHTNGGHGVELAYSWTGGSTPTRMVSASNAATAIAITGSTTSTSGGYFGVQAGNKANSAQEVLIQSVGTGGIDLTGTGGATGVQGLMLSGPASWPPAAPST